MDILELLENLTVEPHQQAIIDAAVDEIERLWKQLEETSTKHERLVFLTMGDLSLRDIEIKGLREEVERLRAELSANDLIDEIAYGTMFEATDEIERLQKALEIAADGFRDCGAEDLEDMCRAAIAKATGGE